MEHHAVPQPVKQRGFTLLEVLIGLSIFALVVGAVYSGYTNVIDIIAKTQYSSAAVSIIESKVEMVRNMRYQDVGTVGGIPAGLLPQTEQVALGGQSFTITTTVRNVDNPFDGTVNGNPRDLNPADYKLVQFDMSCASCGPYGTLSMVTYVAPKTLEDESRNGSLEITVIDASGQPVPQATLHIVYPKASVDLTTTTDNNGKLTLLSVATGSAAYEITASKTGYSTDKTYPPDNPANALKPNVTVATQQLSLQTMVIDRVGTLTVHTQDRFCAPVGPFAFQLTGKKLIGILPDVPKNSSAYTTDSSGNLTLNQIEWDQYDITPTDTKYAIAGTSTGFSFTLDPAATQAYTWVVASRSQSAALVAVTDQSGTPVDGATVHVTGSAYDRTLTTGFWSVGDTDWTGGNFTDASANMDATASGQLTLKLQNGGVYASGSTETLTSQTFDLGTSNATLKAITWNPQSQPAHTTVLFQIAATNDTGSWEYDGPDGTTSSYFDTPGQSIPASMNGKRYIRYRAFLETTDINATPTVTDVSISFSSECLLHGQALFDGLKSGSSYSATVTASGFQQSTASVSISNTWTQIAVPLTPQ
jgi:prepilin-type N-terminal cleavage/methylation domain-containing protein